jgi:hypothetical protein
MIDPRRKAANDQHAQKLLALWDELGEAMPDGDPRAWALVESIYQRSRGDWRFPSLEPTDFLPSKEALEAADGFRESATKALKRAIADDTLVLTANDLEYTARTPLPWLGHNLLNIVAPLTWHVCLELLITLAKLTILINDPGPGAPLRIERARYASQQSELIRVEHSLWELASNYGGSTDRIPFAYRSVLLLMAWDPVAHEARDGGWTVCLRCGELLHRKRRFSELPRCAACMKETPKQRIYPSHAVAPHRRGTWLLECQYPDCTMVFEGPRHRKLCQKHTSAQLPPAQRLTAIKKHLHDR